MAKTKVSVRFQILELLDGFMDGSTMNALGDSIVKGAKERVAEGQSPVRGYGRFERYKNPPNYPGNLKNQRPVNLYLSGSMMSGYGFRKKTQNSIEVGIVNGTSRDREIAGYHNEGTDNMAQRKLVPDQGEEWNVSIMQDIKEVYSSRLASLIRQSNKKS